MKLVVIGSGPSGIHFAYTALERGHEVTLVDMGLSGTDIPHPKASFFDLKQNHPDPVSYFLGDNYDAISLPAAHPGEQGEYYGLPPSKNHVFEHPSRFQFRSSGMDLLLSFAAGGLAEAWTGGAYPFNDGDLAAFGFGHDRMAPHYAKIAERIGVGGAGDDLEQWYPAHEGLGEPIELNEGNRRLLDKYERKRARLNHKHPNVRLGRSRQAALSHDLGDRDGCQQCGRCLWGCPNGAFYTPSLTLRGLLAHPNLTYLPGRFASHFEAHSARGLDALIAYNETGAEEKISGDAFVLACGTISTSNIFLRTIYKSRNEIVQLPGIMDNQQVLAPFLNLGMFGRGYFEKSYQYHQLAMGLAGETPEDFVHCQITSMTTASAHPIISQMPLGMAAGRKVFTALRSALGVVNLNFSDTRRSENILTLDPEFGSDWPGLKLQYRSPPGQKAKIKAALKQLGKFMNDLGAPFVPGMTQIRTPGGSVHYSGTLPISASGGEFTVTEQCQSNDFENLFIVDGSVFPSLPSKNLTLTLMANATRVATEAF
ncbi:MAG: GMC family oxidoreductase [Henriciella sp.]|nr:GMC family oxidoreductase [Henriciella sp.]